MFYIRPVKKTDLDSLTQLANLAHSGLTTLPKDRNYLSQKIDDSLRAFDEKVRRPAGEQYLFVLADSTNEQLLGTSGICSKVGGFQPFYTYKIKKENFEDRDLDIKKMVEVLHLIENHDGPSEICSLFVSPQFRSKGFGRLLSLCRFLFMAEFSHRFDSTIISELRGVSDKNGQSPFWNCVGKLFFEIEFSQADFLTGLGHKNFIKNLMPKYPIYCAMLPVSVQKVIGQVHQKTKPALHLLKKEGFVYAHEVDLFDAGPTVSAPLQNIKTVQQSITSTLSEITNNTINSKEHIITNSKLDFKACFGKVLTKQDGTICINKDVAQCLNLQTGDVIRFS